ncbi:MAG: ABC transporter substrate-binding protein, partial [Thermocrispum sp.]
MIDRVRLRRGMPALLLPLALSLAMVAAGCDTAGGEGGPQAEQRVTLVTDESWELPRELRAAFERQTDLKLVHRKVGRTPAELVERLAAHKGKPFGDVVAGIDTSTVTGALAGGTLAPYTSPEANKGQQRFSVDKRQRLSALDRLTVCVNVDEDWFAERNEAPPERAADLTSAAYRRLLAVPSPQSTADGTGFLLGSVAREGEDGWRPFWSRLKANGVRVLASTAEVREH